MTEQQIYVMRHLLGLWSRGGWARPRGGRVGRIKPPWSIPTVAKAPTHPFRSEQQRPEKSLGQG